MLPTYLVLLAALMAPAVSFAQEQETQERQAVQRGSRSPGDNPQTGTAVPRGAAPRTGGDRDRRDGRDDRDGRGDNRGGRTVVVPDYGRRVVRPQVYNYYYPNPYYYSRPSYPYGYNSFGFGYLYYDPYGRSPGAYSPYRPGYYASPYSSFDIGELRLNVSPRHGQVYVDGYYAGTVDDFDGAFQALKLDSGDHRIEIVAPGYETLGFDVRINPGRKITYRGDLIRGRP